MEQCRAILVRRHRWSESSLITVWLSDRFGTLRTSARGALRPQSPFAGKLDLFSEAEVVFQPARSGTLHPLREVTILRPFLVLNYPALTLASYFSELSASVAPEMQPSHEIFDLLSRAFAYLTSHPASRKALDHFESETARLLGILDPSGKMPPHRSLANLCGNLPPTRKAALELLTPTKT